MLWIIKNSRLPVKVRDSYNFQLLVVMHISIQVKDMRLNGFLKN